MFGAKFVAIVVVTLWLSKSNFHFEAYGDVTPTPTSCLNCPQCDPSCQQITPPLSGDPSYGAPPPPQLSPPPSGYSIYGAPPPPPHKAGQSKCPPASATGSQCCTPPTPYTPGYGYGPPNSYYGPPNSYYGPPTPYYGPPNPYNYVPYGEAQGPASMILPILVPLMMLFSYFTILV